jgi:hypothetical protein
VGLIFNYFIRRAYFGWWSKFPCRHKLLIREYD